MHLSRVICTLCMKMETWMCREKPHEVRALFRRSLRLTTVFLSQPALPLCTLNSTLPLTPNYPFPRPLSPSPALSCTLHQSCIQLTHCQSGPLSPLRPPTQDINLYQLSTLSKLDKRDKLLTLLCVFVLSVFCLPSLSLFSLFAAF